MNTLHFAIDIQADKNTIWQALWDEQNYRQWAAVFSEGSYFLIDNWQVGGQIMFLAPDKSGIYSNIEQHIPNQIIQFRHIGNVKEGKEQPIDEETKKWSGATEIYSLQEGPTAITLAIEIDVMDEHLAFMTTKFPQALEVIKKNCR